MTEAVSNAGSSDCRRNKRSGALATLQTASRSHCAMRYWRNGLPAAGGPPQCVIPARYLFGLIQRAACVAKFNARGYGRNARADPSTAATTKARPGDPKRVRQAPRTISKRYAISCVFAESATAEVGSADVVCHVHSERLDR